MADLAQVLSRKAVRRLAGESYYERGLDYFDQGRVLALQGTPNGLRAGVQGEHTYEVRLEDIGGQLDYDCTCPIGKEGFFCKHCVAAALAFLDAGNTAKARNDTPADGLTTEAAVDLLLDQDRDVLRATLLRWAKLNPWLEGRIFLHGANAEAPTAAWKAVLSSFHRNLTPGDFSSEEEWLQSFLGSCDMLSEGLELGMEEMIIDLCEAGLDVAASEIASIGYPTEDGEALLQTLQTLHLDACKRARPNPIALAERLFEWEKRSIYDVFFDSARTYRKILGPKGLQRTRELAEQLWKKNKNKTPQNGDAITALMVLESLAEIAGSVDDQAAAMALDLGSPHRYRRIADLYHRKGQIDSAIQWLERGRAAFPQDTEARLAELAAVYYGLAGRHDEAASVAFAAFDAAPSSYAFEILRTFAKSGTDWEKWVDKAIVRAREEKAKPLGNMTMTSLLVEMLTQLGRLDEAWKEAEGALLAPQVWLALADASIETHPANAASAYLRQAEHALSGEGSSSRYKRAVDLLEQCAACMQRAGKSAEFMLTLQDLRNKYKRRRKLQELLGKRWKHLDLRPKST